MAYFPSDTAGVTHPTGQSKYYVVIISSSRWGHVQAWLPDAIQISVRSNWGPVVSTDLPAALNFLTANFFSGSTLFSKRLTAQEWRGSEPLELTLPLHFFATQDSKTEVIEPIKRLLKMSLPRRREESTSDSFLVAPGPIARLFGKDTDTGQGEGADLINVYVGNYLRLPRMFISLIQNVEFKAKLDKNGFPMEAVTTIVFRTLYSPIAENVDEYLGIYTGNNPNLTRPDTIGF
jgi:hypothetical protein